jgi:7-cyano-7-deazaguanine synthase
MYDAVCLTSGGLDSMVCLHLLRERGIEALPVFINYGQRNLTREFGALAQNLRAAKFPPPQIIDLSGFGKTIKTGLTSSKKRVLEDAFTPNRNLACTRFG